MSSRSLSRVVLLGWLAVLMLAPAGSAAQQDPMLQLLAGINGMRVANGLPPLAPESALESAAQSLSEEMAANASIVPDVSDGSTLQQRVVAANYPAYSTGAVVTQLVTGGPDRADVVLDGWAYDERLLSTGYREIGIGLAPGRDDDQFYWTVILGARPNVLPVFINLGAPQTGSPDVSLTFSNEGAMIDGDGPDVIGLANEIRLANGETAANAEWQPWVDQLAWLLADGEGVQVVTVEFRDQIGRTTTSRASIYLGAGGTETAPVVQTPVVAVTRTAVSTTASRGTPAVTRPAIRATEAAPTVDYQAFESRPVPFYRWLDFRPEVLLPAACGLQVLASLLGFVVATRRRRPSRGDGSSEGEESK